MDAPEVLDSTLLAMWNKAHREIALAERAVISAKGAESFTRRFIEEKYGLGAKDAIDGDTGVITRAPKPEPVT